MSRSLLLGASLLVASFATSHASAERPPGRPQAPPAPSSSHTDGDDVRAQRLFDAGLEAVSAGNWQLALGRFLESQRYDPAPGTTLNVARSREQLGQLAEAIVEFRAVVRALPASDERAKYAQSRIAALEPRVGHVILSLPPGLREARVHWDGIPLPATVLDTPLPVNPGRHEVSVSATGRAREVIRLVVNAGDHTELMLGDDEPVEPPDASAASAKQPAAKPLGAHRLLIYGSLGIGTASLIGSAVTGLIALDRKSTVESNCHDQRCNVEGLEANHSGSSFATISTVCFGAGVALLGAGATLFYFDREHGSRRVGLSTTEGGARLVVEGSL